MRAFCYTLRGAEASVFIGSSWTDYMDRYRAAPSLSTACKPTGTLALIANRISYFLGITGASLTLDASCAASLVAIHLACQNLRNREAPLALVGGVNLMLSPSTMVAMSKFGGLALMDSARPSMQLRTDMHAAKEPACLY